MNNELYHYGTKRHSGRYPWGSGERPYQGDPQERKARRKAKLQEFGQKAKKVAKTAGKIAGRAALSAGVSVLTTSITSQVMRTAITSDVLKSIEQKGRDFLNANADLSYKLIGTDAGKILSQMRGRKDSGLTYGDKANSSLIAYAYAQKAGESYMKDWEKNYLQDYPFDVYKMSLYSSEYKYKK